MKTLALALAVALLPAPPRPAVQDPPAPAVAWSLEADLVESCCCAPICPCIVGSPPTRGHCLGNRLVEIRKGRNGDVVLDGVSMVLVFRVGAWSKMFVGERASEEQVRAARALLELQSGFLFGDVLAVERVPLAIERTETTIAFSVPQASTKVTVMTGEDDKPIRILNLRTFKDYVQYVSTELTHTGADEARRFSFERTNGFSARYRAASAAEDE